MQTDTVKLFSVTLPPADVGVSLDAESSEQIVSPEAENAENDCPKNYPQPNANIDASAGITSPEQIEQTEQLEPSDDADYSASSAQSDATKKNRHKSDPLGKISKERKMRMPLSTRFIVMLVIFGITISTISTWISYYTYQRMNINKYRYSADNVARLANDIIDADKIDGYLASSKPDENYGATVEKLRHLAERTGAAYIRLIRASADGKWRMIYDTARQAHPLGYEMDVSDAYGKTGTDEMSRLMADGRYYGPHILSPLDDAPALLVIMMPLTDASGDVKGHTCVEFSLSVIKSEQHQFLLKIILAQFLVTAIFCILYLFALRKTVVIPVKLLAKHADDFLRYAAGKRNPGKSMNIFSNLRIDSDDELKVLQIALQQMESKINTHIGELTIANRRASTDSLTGLRNREYFHRRVSDFLWSQSCKPLPERLGCAFIMIDLDYFKSINDRYGHAEGDQCLIKFATAIRATFRADDVIARMGGDEFAVFCENIPDPNIIRRKTELLRKKLETILVGNSKAPITASIGIYVSKGEFGDYKTLYEFSDRAMYKVKENGRNGFEIFTAKEISGNDTAKLMQSPE